MTYVLVILAMNFTALPTAQQWVVQGSPFASEAECTTAKDALAPYFKLQARCMTSDDYQKATQ